MRRRNVRIERMSDEGDAARPEARVLVGAWDLLGEFRREGAVDGRGVAADLLAHAAGHERHDPSAAVVAAMVPARPRGLHEAAGGLSFTSWKSLGRILDRLEARADQPLELGEPGAGAVLPRLAEGLGRAGLLG